MEKLEAAEVSGRETSEPREHSVSTRPNMPHYDVIPAAKWVRRRLVSVRTRLSRTSKVVVAGVLASAVVGFAAGWLGGNHSTNLGSGILTATTGSQKQIVTSESQLINSIAKTVGPSVVSVNVTSTSQNNNNLFSFPGLSQTEQSAGTGIILTSSGLVITNRHVVPSGATTVSVTLADGTELRDVTVIGRTSQNSSLDIAFLKINNTQGEKLTPAVIGDSSKVQVGDSVVAIGNALGQFQNTVTSGIISGYGRSVQASSSGTGQDSENLDNLFQTDAAINEGNSGGPLVNLNGQVIGINTAIAGNAQNIGFAIPINDVKGLIQQAVSSGKLQQPWLGVYYIPITNDVAQQYSLNVSRGAWIPPMGVIGQDPIVAGGPADKAGLQAGDIITQADGTSIDQAHSLTSVISQDNVGQQVTLTVVRNGKTLHIQTTLQAEPAS